MAVVTVSRKLGSGGDNIADKAAQTLGYHFVDKELVGTVLSQYGLIDFAREYDYLPSFWEKFSAQKEGRREEMVNMLNRVIRAVAYHGNVVILGRSGFSVLEGFSDVLNVRIQAPLAFRVKQVMMQQKIAADRAETIVRYSDKVRSAFVKTFYGVQWDTTSAFDLLINTRKVSSELAIGWLVEAAKSIDERAKDDRPTTASIQVDSILDDAVSETLKCNATHRP
jgi:cytidylate kinase